MPSSFPSGPHVHFASEPEAGRTHTDEAGRSKAASPTLSSGASAKESGEVFLFLLMLISVLFSDLFLSALLSTLLSVLALTVTFVLNHGSHGPWLALREAHSLAYNVFGLTRKFLPTQFFFCLSI